jgi:elongation factor Ts
MNIDLVKQLREKTGISIAECKKALESASGDMGKALEVLKERSLAIADKKSGAEVGEGIIEAYIHGNAKIGALLELNCQTDFVARSPEFKGLARDLAIHIAAASPEDINSLLVQPFIKDPSRKIQDLITEHIAKIGENIKVSRFTLYQL